MEVIQLTKTSKERKCAYILRKIAKWATDRLDAKSYPYEVGDFEDTVQAIYNFIEDELTNEQT